MAEPALGWRRAEFELDPPRQNARGVWQRRRSLILELRDPSGCTGRGEAAPLPGYCQDTLEESERALGAISSGELRRLLEPTLPGELLQAVAEALPAGAHAARFGLETALLDRLARRQARPLWALLRELWPAPGEPQPVQVCALLPSELPERALELARRHFERGVRCFKLKIGPARLLLPQRELLAALRRTLGDGVELRLDANQSLERGELHETFAALASFRPELVEEPLTAPEPGDLAALSCGWALDESLQSLKATQLARLSSVAGCRALVLKPTALGGFQRCLQLAAVGRAAGQRVVVSHTLEGELGWLACLQLAVALGPSAPAGLWPPAQAGMDEALVAGALPVPQQPGLGAAV